MRFLAGPCLALHLLSISAWAQASDSTVWRAMGELSFTDVAGNRSLSLLSTRLTVSRNDPARLELRGSAGLRYGRSEGQLAIADYTSSLEARFSPARTISPFITLAANRDEVRSLDIRLAIAAGADLNLVRDSLAEVAVGLAALQDYEVISAMGEVPGPANRSLTRASLRARAQFPLRDGVLLRHQSMLQPVVQELEDYLLTTETGVAVLLSERLALQTSFTFNRDATPPQGVLFRNDRTMTVGLLVNLR